jgi:two-component system LytT family response regulator
MEDEGDTQMTTADSFGPARALICEDEPLAVKALREYLRDVDWIQVIGEARDGSEAVRLIQKHEPDLVFLDVRMPGLSGLEVLETITHHPAIVFTTAFDEYAVPAFEFGAVDYLVKPFGKERLLETLDRVRVRMLGEGLAGRQKADGPTERYLSRLFARDRGRIVPVPTRAIIRIDATPVGVTLRTKAGTFSTDASMGELQERLDPRDFVRVHRSHIVNLTHVATIRRYDERRLILKMDDGSGLVASRQGSKSLRQLMG